MGYVNLVKNNINYIKNFIVSLVLLFTLGAQIAQAKIETVSINASGTGKTEALAIQAALVQAVSKVNGVQIAASTQSSISEIF